MTEKSWHSMHIYYYDVNKDALILDCIRPLIATLNDRIYFTRHWQGGSHLRLHVHASPSLFEHEIAPYIQAKVESYLHEHPSDGEFTEAESQRQHLRRSNFTRAKLAYTAPVANNTVHIMPYTLVESIGSVGMAQLLENYYIENNDLAFTIMEQTRNSYSARLNACFDQLIAFVAAASIFPLTSAYMSYRSHAEAYIVCEPDVEDPDVRRLRFEQAFHERRHAVLQRVKRLIKRIETAPEQLSAWLRAMIAMHRLYHEKALQGILDGLVKLMDGEKELSEQQEPPPFRLGASSFHAAAASNEAVKRFQKEPDVLANRIALNFLYLQLSRIGLLNEDRYILDYYIAEAIEELYQLSPVEILRNYRSSEIAV